jgi:hypothetical protein
MLEKWSVTEMWLYAVKSPNFLGFGKNITPFAIKLCFQEIFTPFLER